MIDVVIPTRHLDRVILPPQDGLVDSVTLVMRPEWGFTRQVEDGWKGTTAPFVLFLNDDCAVTEINLAELMIPMADPSVGIVGPTLQCGDYQSNPFKAHVPQEAGQLPLYITVHHLVGACLLVRRSALVQVAGWDTDFILHCSDLDLCIRMREASYKVVWAVRTVVEHEAHVTLDEMPQDIRAALVQQDEETYQRKHPTERGVMAQRGYGQAIYPEKALTTI